MKYIKILSICCANLRGYLFTTIPICYTFSITSKRVVLHIICTQTKITKHIVIRKCKGRKHSHPENTLQATAHYNCATLHEILPGKCLVVLSG